MTKCSNCGHENKEYSKYCVKCGNALLQPMQDTKHNQENVQQAWNEQMINNPMFENTTRKKKCNGIIIGVIIFVVIASIAIVEAFFLFGGNKKEEMEPHKEVVKNFEDALNEKDLDKYIEVLPLGDNAENAKVRESMERSMRGLKRNVNYKFEIINTTHLERAELENLEKKGLNYLSDLGAEDVQIDFNLTDGYIFDCEYSYIDWEGKEMYDNATIKVGKWNGKWYIFDCRL